MKITYSFESDKALKRSSREKGARDKERLAAIKYMRFEEKKTLKEIGDHFGLSRERIRQLIGNSRDVQRQRVKEKRIDEFVAKKMKKKSFFDFVNKTDGCWIWTGITDPSGYGRFRRKYAHRVSFEMHKGRIAKGLYVLHSCDNPSCVNPDHLSAGTHKDNTQDAIKKGRFVPGSYFRGLSDEQISEIRALAKSKIKSQREIAKIFNVSQGHISLIVNEHTRKTLIKN